MERPVLGALGKGRKMNQARRKEIARVQGVLAQLLTEVENLQSDEQEAFDNLPESLQYGERGEKMEDAIDDLQSTIDAIEEAINNLELAAA